MNTSGFVILKSNELNSLVSFLETSTIAGAKAVATFASNILIAFDVESFKPACNREFDNLFSVKSAEVAFECNTAVSQSHPESVVPLSPNKYLYVSFSTLITLGPISGLQLSILTALFDDELSAVIPI